MKITFTSDTHGDFDLIDKVCQEYNNPIIHCGDVGIGFPKQYILGKGYVSEPNSFPDNFFFIRGNHDSPEVCRKFPNYLGDYGFNDQLHIFYVSGGMSIDKNQRKSGIDWWEEEELSIKQLNNMLNLYSEIKPRYVISHEAPARLCRANGLIKLGGEHFPSRTSLALDAMLDIHKPKIWYMGHHHQYCKKRIEGTTFIVLDINQVITCNL